MQIELMLILSIIVCLLYGISRKIFSRQFSGALKPVNFYNGIVSIVSAIVLLFWGGVGTISTFTLLTGLAFGLLTAMQYLFMLKAISIGSWAYTTVVATLSTIIPTLSGWLFWNESISLVQIIGIILMFACFILSTDLSSGESKKLSLTWLFYAILVFLCTGGIGVMQKVHSTSAFSGEQNGFLLIAFAFASVFAFLMFTIVHFREKKTKPAIKNEQKQRIKSLDKYYSIIWIAVMIVSGVFVAMNNKYNLYLSGVLDSALFFPLVNGSNLILTTLFSCFIFKDKLKKQQWIGLIVGMISITLLCNPFGW